MLLTPEVMEQEAQAVAEGFADMLEAGMDPSKSMTEKVTALLSGGFETFGDVEAGLDDNANRIRFGLEVAAKTMDILVSRLLPLTS